MIRMAKVAPDGTLFVAFGRTMEDAEAKIAAEATEYYGQEPEWESICMRRVSAYDARQGMPINRGR